MRELDYQKPKTMEEAVRALTRGGDRKVKLIAGGTDLMGAVNLRISPVETGTIVSIKGLGLDGIESDDEGISIGAASLLDDIANHDEIKKRLPLLAEAARSVASPQIRHVATIGGNICQEPRCWYYRHPDNRFHCMRKGGDLCNSMTGNNAYHSVLGGAEVRTPPCGVGCPNETDIPAYFDEVRIGNLTEAARIFSRVNPLGSVTGRVCPHDCQRSCNRNEFDEAVGIRNIERVVCDHAIEHFDEVYGDTFGGITSGKSVGIIGAGPAGLTAAWYLRARGHAVTVYDRNKEIGGMLRYAIPAYRLPVSVTDGIKRVYDRIGVTFNLGVENAPAPDEILKEHAAVLVSSGAWVDNEVSFEGSEHVLSGLTFLYGLREGRREKPGERVVVIGGGNVAVDVAVSAKRLGCDVTIIYRRSRAEMPAYDEEIENALAEGVRLITNVTPVKITADDPVVTGVLAASCRSVGGRDTALIVDDSDIVRLEADAVIAAIGQKTDVFAFPHGVAMNERGRALTDPVTGASSVAGVFAAGDAVTGPATVVEAIAGGRHAAYGIHAYLTGEITEDPARKTGQGKALYFDPSCILSSTRLKPSASDTEGRGLDDEDVAPLSGEGIRAEANRCLNCGCVAVTPSDIAPALVALGADVITTERRIPAEAFFQAGVESSTVLLRGEIVTRIFVPDQPAGSVQGYRKFRTRKAIDFPIASVASVIAESDGTIASASIVLGGAAPVPYRAKAAEEAVIGKPADDGTARTAAELAVKGMISLAENGYKIRVFEALVRRAVAGV
jgi:NADPH-dependent glutamate synthase beta subunit-like oxidoreductase/CO/xanthine dehydrogenase FAD-binding subunit